MAKIYEMPPHLADLIAAGEVVERPGSVVKELCENSIDAGASSVTVEIRGGGMSFIRVTDNGCGIAPEDAETAFLRHATSKLRDERGLEAIRTLGFRGEALAAIAAVSRVELLTRERGADAGTRLTLEGGKVTGKSPEGCPDGTTMIVRDLFYNTPARLKFMKNDRAEGTNVSSVVLRLALSHPEVSFRYLREGTEECHTPGDGKLRSCVYSVLGRDFAAGLLEAEGSGDGYEVSGFVTAPSACRGNRSWQFFFLNGRFIRSKLLQAALEQAYRNQLFTGRYPACALDIRTSPSAVDVNVHPTKTEVRFLDEKKAFDAVYWAARGALEKGAAPAAPAEDAVPPAAPAASESAPAPRASGAQPVSAKAEPRSGFFKSVPAAQFRSAYAGGAKSGFSTAVPPAREAAAPAAPVRDELRAPYQTAIDLPGETRGEPPFRLIGEAMDTYLIAEKGGSIFLIDKHAAHERIIFDRLKREKREAASQVLLTPAVCRPGGDAAERLLENKALLSEFGIELDDFGGGCVALRQVPADIDEGDPDALLEELARALEEGGRRGLEGMRDGVMHTVACRAAIKAGKRSEPAAVLDLVRRVLSGEVKYCPHGRPVCMEITKAELDRGFKRI